MINSRPPHWSSPPPTMGCRLMLTENANFVTGTLRGDLSTVNVRPWCGHYTCSVHQWIGNWILPKFVPRMSSLALLEADIHLPLYITGKNCVDCICADAGVWCGWFWFPFMLSCGGSDDVYNCAILKHEVGTAWLPNIAHSAPPPKKNILILKVAMVTNEHQKWPKLAIKA